MSFRGRGRGRGGFGGGPRYVKEVPFEPFSKIEGLGTAEYSITQIQMVKRSTNQNKDCHLSLYYWEDISERPKRQKVDIKRYSGRQSRATRVKPPLWDVIRLDIDYMPGEISRGGGAKRNKKFKLASVSGDSCKMTITGWNKLEHFEELAQKRKGQDGVENKDDKDEDEDVVGEEDDGEFSDEGDYEQGEYCDDDEDDFNVADDNDDEPMY